MAEKERRNEKKGSMGEENHTHIVRLSAGKGLFRI